MSDDSAVQRTLVLLKPDAVARGLTGRVLARFDDALLKIVAAKMVWMDAELTRQHYFDLEERFGPEVYGLMARFMQSGPVIALVLEGVGAVPCVRKIVGSTYPDQAAPGTIRGDFAHMSRAYANANGVPVANLVHASGNADRSRARDRRLVHQGGAVRLLLRRPAVRLLTAVPGMEENRNQPDEVARAALEAVSEAVELADSQLATTGQRQPRSVRGRGIRGRISRRLARRADRARGERRLSATLRGAARRGAHVTGRGVSAGGRWLSAQVLAMAPRLPVRDLATLRAQFPGRSPDELAAALIDGASRASAAVGMAVGAWAVLPFLPAAGVEIATETLSVVGIEIKLVAELHEVYGQAVPGNVAERMTAYVGAWAQRRGVGTGAGRPDARGGVAARQAAAPPARRPGRAERILARAAADRRRGRRADQPPGDPQAGPHAQRRPAQAVALCGPWPDQPVPGI